MNSKRDNLSLGCAGLAAGTTAASIKTQNILHYQIGGRSYVKPATDNIALTPFVLTPAVPFVALAASSIGLFFVLVDVNGNIAIRQWAGNGLAGVAGNGATAAIPTAVPASNSAQYQPFNFEWPGEDAGWAIIGAFKVATNASGAYTAGTTSQAAANQVVTYYNVGQDLGVAIAA